MAADSIVGAEFLDSLSPELQSLVESVLGDTQGSTIEESVVGTGTFYSGIGANNESQGVLAPGEGETVGELLDGLYTAFLELPADVGLTFEGIDSLITGSAASTFFTDLIDGAVDQASDFGLALATSLKNAVDAITPNDSDNVVRLINVLDNSTATTEGEIIISGEADNAVNEVIALNMNNVNANNTVVVNNLDKVVVVGSGAVTIGDDTSASVAGDNRDQVLTGGGGNDTLVGGGGNDTLAGGAGENTFGVNNADGNLTISDFGTGDVLAFSLAGITSLDELKASISDFSLDDGNFTANFTNGSTITLVGVTADQVTADLIVFTS